MRIATGTVIDGKVVCEGDPLVEGAIVVVLALDEDETFEVTEAEEEALLDAIAQADRGEGVDGERFLDELDSGR